MLKKAHHSASFHVSISRVSNFTVCIRDIDFNIILQFALYFLWHLHLTFPDQYFLRILNFSCACYKFRPSYRFYTIYVTVFSGVRAAKQFVTYFFSTFFIFFSLTSRYVPHYVTNFLEQSPFFRRSRLSWSRYCLPVWKQNVNIGASHRSASGAK